MSVNTTAVAIVSFAVGWIFGFVSRMFFDRNNKKTLFDYRIFVLMTISLIWSISVIYEIFDPIYQTSPLIHGLMGGIVGFFFEKRNNDKPKN